MCLTISVYLVPSFVLYLDCRLFEVKAVSFEKLEIQSRNSDFGLFGFSGSTTI